MSLLAEQLLTSEEGLCAVVLVTQVAKFFGVICLE
jgi:hypothetical protein